jgi:hypothetical protein
MSLKRGTCCGVSDARGSAPALRREEPLPVVEMLTTTVALSAIGIALVALVRREVTPAAPDTCVFA